MFCYSSSIIFFLVTLSGFLGARLRVQRLEKGLPLPPLKVAGILFALLLYLVLIGPVDYFLLRRLGRLEWTWFTYPTIVLLFAGGITAWGLTGRGGRVIASQIQVLDLLPEIGLARSTTTLAVFTPYKGIYRFDSSMPEAQLGPSGIAQDRLSGARLVDARPDTHRSRARIAANASAIAFLESRWHRPLELVWPELRGRNQLVELRVTDGRVELTSRLPFALDEAVLLEPDGKNVQLGRLAPGERRAIDPPGSTAPTDEASLVAGALKDPDLPHLVHGVDKPGRYLLIARGVPAVETLTLDDRPLGEPYRIVRISLWPDRSESALETDP